MSNLWRRCSDHCWRDASQKARKLLPRLPRYRLQIRRTTRQTRRAFWHRSVYLPCLRCAWHRLFTDAEGREGGDHYKSAEKINNLCDQCRTAPCGSTFFISRVPIWAKEEFATCCMMIQKRKMQALKEKDKLKNKVITNILSDLIYIKKELGQEQRRRTAPRQSPSR